MSRLAVFTLAAALSVSISYDLWRTPVQVWDAIEEIMAAQHSPSVAASFESATGTTAYLRPLRIAQIKALFDLSQGNYRLAYRGFHVALLLLLSLALGARTALRLGLASGRFRRRRCLARHRAFLDRVGLFLCRRRLFWR